MEDKRDINNIISICGEISSNFSYSHEVYGEKFYDFKVSVERNSGFNDILPLFSAARSCIFRKGRDAALRVIQKHHTLFP